MKDANDTSTAELFPVPKKRGRPSTGKAKTSAERQARHRQKKYSEENKDNLNVWINTVCKHSLELSAKVHHMTVAERLEKLIRDFI